MNKNHRAGGSPRGFSCTEAREGTVKSQQGELTELGLPARPQKVQSPQRWRTEAEVFCVTLALKQVALGSQLQIRAGEEEPPAHRWWPMW